MLSYNIIQELAKEELKKSPDYQKIRSPKCTMVKLDKCCFCEKHISENENMQTRVLFQEHNPRFMFFNHCKDCMHLADLSHVFDLIRDIVFPLYPNYGKYYKIKEDRDNANLINIRWSKSMNEPIMFFKFSINGELHHVHKTYAQFLEHNSREDLIKILDDAISSEYFPKHYPKILIDLFTKV